jgi:hypothetical protein
MHLFNTKLQPKSFNLSILYRYSIYFKVTTSDNFVTPNFVVFFIVKRVLHCRVERFDFETI